MEWCVFIYVPYINLQFLADPLSSCYIHIITYVSLWFPYRSLLFFLVDPYIKAAFYIPFFPFIYRAILIIPYEATRFLIYPSAVLACPFISLTLPFNEFRCIPFDSFSILPVPLWLFPYNSIWKKQAFLIDPYKDLSGNFCTNLGSARIFAVRLRGKSCSFLILGNPVNYLWFLVKPSKLPAGKPRVHRGESPGESCSRFSKASCQFCVSASAAFR